MTFSRAQMIEAYKAGMRIVGGSTSYTSVDRDAEEYVGNLQSHPPVPLTSFRIDDDPKYELAYQVKLEALDTTIRELILKTQERELVLAKVLGSFIGKLPFYFETTGPRADSALFDAVADAASQINRVFPELTPDK